MTLTSGHWGKGPFIRALAMQTGEASATAEDAITAGRYSAEQQQKDGYVAVKRTTHTMRPFLENPAKTALNLAGVSGADLGLITHTAIHDHGAEGLWQPAAFLQKTLNAPNALGWGLYHGCNGFALAMAQAEMMMPSLPGPALIVAADIFEGSGFDRWQSDKGLAYGDASAAMLLDAHEGFARVVYQDTVSIAALEAMHRSDTPATAATRWDISRTKLAYFAKHGGPAFFAQIEAALQQMTDRLSDALARSGQRINAVVTPFVGKSVSTTTYEAYFHPFAPNRTTSALGMRTGHTGTTDQVIGLAHHLEQNALSAGGHVLLIGAGAGFSLSATVIRLERPAQNPSQGVYL